MKIYLLLALFLLPFLALAQTEKGATPIPTQNSKLQTQNSTRAVVIGISDYQDAAIPDLRFADRDAQAFANFLRSPAGGALDGDHLKVLTNQNATAGRIAEALDALVERTREGDQVVIYFSGHCDVERNIFSQPGFLLCWDAPSRVYMGGGTYSLAYLEAVVTTLSVQNKARVTVITDACHAGKLSGSQIGGAQLTSANLARQYANEVKILSCQPNEYSIEGEQWGGGRGCFSFHLVDGLFGLADRNADGTVTVGEIDRYLEDRVTAEAAPQSQVPMLLGNKTERLATVDAAILADLQKYKSGQMPVFAPVEQRGFEDEVLAGVDSSIRELYRAFKLAVQEKRFFEPAGDCSEDYYERLSQVEALAPLRGVMKRNYAAALQDDAQQVMNSMLESGLTEEVRIGGNPVKLYVQYPRYLQRAAELLGEGHYMYAPLQARKYYFEGMIATALPEIRQAFQQALHWQPGLPHVLAQMISIQKAEQADSAYQYYTQAIAQAPAWVVPPLFLAGFYYKTVNLPSKAEEMLARAEHLDSNSIYVWYCKGLFYQNQKRLKEAEYWYRKVVSGSGTAICFPCAYLNLGVVYSDTRRYVEAEAAYNKSVELDSTFANAFACLGNVYFFTRRYVEAETALKKAILLDSTLAKAYNTLGVIYKNTERFTEAEAAAQKAVGLDSTYANAYNTIGSVCLLTRRYAEAEVAFSKAIGFDSASWIFPANLGLLYHDLRRWEACANAMRKAIKLGPPIAALTAALANAYTHLPAHFAEARLILDKTLEMEPDYPDTHIHLAQWMLINRQPDEAWQALEKGLENGLENGNLTFDHLQTEPDFETFRQESRWNELMKKYFPDKVKD